MITSRQRLENRHFMHRKSRWVAVQIAVVVVAVLALIVYSFTPTKVKDARVRLDVLEAHRGLKRVISSGQRYAADHDRRLPPHAVFHVVGDGTHEQLAIDDRLETFWCGTPRYIREIPASPFVVAGATSGPIILGRTIGETSFWYAFIPGPGSAQTPPPRTQVEAPALSSDQWYAITNGLHSPGYVYRDTLANVSMGSTR